MGGRSWIVARGNVSAEALFNPTGMATLSPGPGLVQYAKVKKGVTQFILILCFAGLCALISFLEKAVILQNAQVCVY